jgi:hypothetical protein
MQASMGLPSIVMRFVVFSITYHPLLSLFHTIADNFKYSGNKTKLYPLHNSRRRLG